MTTPQLDTWYKMNPTGEEAAAHISGGGEVQIGGLTSGEEWQRSAADADEFAHLGGDTPLTSYRLVFEVPSGMSPVNGSPSSAYGTADLTPDGWQQRAFSDDEFEEPSWSDSAIIEVAPKVEAYEWIPLTKLEGRTIRGNFAPVFDWRWRHGVGTWRTEYSDWLAVPVDQETGLVEVVAE